MDTYASVLILSVLAACLGQALALRCYSCDSLKDKNCDLSQENADKDKILQVECGQTDCNVTAKPSSWENLSPVICADYNRSCWHQVSVTSSRDQYEWVESGRHVMRGCGIRREDDSRDTCKSYDANGGPIEACYCPNDLCNSATATHASTFFIIVSILIFSLKLWR